VKNNTDIVMNNNGLVALAAALRQFPVPETMEELSAAKARTYEDDAAAILGERGVFLPDGVCNHIGLINALKDNAATIATLRAELDGWLQVIDLAGDQMLKMEGEIATLCAALEEAVPVAFGVPDDGKWYEVRGLARRSPYGIAETAVFALGQGEEAVG
jgi:hypothetical protein